MKTLVWIPKTDVKWRERHTLASRGTGTLLTRFKSPESHASGIGAITAAVAKVAKKRFRKSLSCIVAMEVGI